MPALTTEQTFLFSVMFSVADIIFNNQVLLFYIFIYLMEMGILPVCMSVQPVCAWCPQRRKKVPDHPELE